MEPGLVDSHIHILPGLDDGPSHFDEAVEMARALGELGYTLLCATPHQRQGYWCPSPPEIERAGQQLAAALAQAGLAIELQTAGENHVDARLLERLERGELPLLGRGRAVLLELPDLGLGPVLDRLLFELLTRGHVPVIAHPERHEDLFADRRRIPALRERGARLQVCLTSLAGRFGRAVAQRAASLLERGECDLVATDAHSGGQVRELVVPGLKRLERLVGRAELVRLAGSEPARLLRPSPPRDTPPRPTAP